MNKKVLPAFYFTAFWCLFVVLLFFWLYCVTAVTPFIERSEGWSLRSVGVLDQWQQECRFFAEIQIRCKSFSSSPRRKPVQYRKWSPTANDPETANDPQNGPQMILDRKWSPKMTANDPVKIWGMEWILWDWLQKRTDYKKRTFFSRPPSLFL